MLHIQYLILIIGVLLFLYSITDVCLFVGHQMNKGSKALPDRMAVYPDLNMDGARCSSVVELHGAMGRRIDPSWWTHSDISRSSQCKNAVLFAMVHIKEPFLLN